MRVPFITAALIAALVGATSAMPAQAGQDGTCTQLHRFFYVKSASLDETITAHWIYNDNADQKAEIDTIQTGTLRLRGGKLPPRADRKKGHGYADFTELQRLCRIPNYRHGQLYDALPMTYSLQGNWSSAGGQTGTCADDETKPRILRGTFVRRSLNWHYPTAGFRWELPTAPFLRCTFKTENSEGDPVTRRLDTVYPLVQKSTKQLTFTKKLLLNAKTITIPVDLHGDKASGGQRWSYDLKGSVVLQRYRACKLVTLQDILHGRHCYDPAYP